MKKRPSNQGVLAEVAVGLPVRGTFYYLFPPFLQPLARIGLRVQVPFGRRKVVTGFIVGLPESSDRTDLKEIEEIPDPEPLFDSQQLEFYRFVAHYYHAPLGEVIRTALPAGLFKSTRPVLALSGAGEATLQGTILSEADRQILDHFRGGTELTLRALNARLNRDVKADVQRLLRWKFLDQHYRLPPLTAKRKTETIWRLRPGVKIEEAANMLGRATEKRLATLQFLAEQPDWVNVKQVQEVVNQPRPTLNLLVSAGLVEESDREVYRCMEVDYGCFTAADVELNNEQKLAVDTIEQDMQAGRYQPYCLHGVTGSGKTEVYLQLAQRSLRAGKAAIVLVPEISLTPQFLGRFICRLGEVVAPYHSQLSDGERYDQWRKMKRGEAQVVVGARSGLFAPFANVGMIIVDEEHDASFKQDEGVPYHARDLALKLGTMHGCPVVLGSATPSLESYYAAKSGRYTLLRLSERPAGASMPAVEIVDMKREMEKRRPRGEKKQQDKQRKETSDRRVLSRRMTEELTEKIAAGEQVILFLNRRGYASYAFCLECGHPLRCPLCDITLTYHAKKNLLRCHYCDYHSAPPATCPHCAGVHLFFGGMGTERLEKEVRERLPDARVLRMDRDTIRGKNDLYKTLTAFAKGEADILLGTQMVAKGHDFPQVTLVGIIDADAALMLPDFRAAERAFQLVCQVAGRAGRAEKAGTVILQTFQPEHYALRAAARHDYPAFFAEENERRKALNYPPTGRLAVLKITAPNAKVGLAACRRAREAGAWALSAGDVAGGAVLGPASSLFHRLHGKHHWNLLVKADKAAGLHTLCGRILQKIREDAPNTASFKLDIDPQAVL